MRWPGLNSSKPRSPNVQHNNSSPTEVHSSLPQTVPNPSVRPNAQTTLVPASAGYAPQSNRNIGGSGGPATVNLVRNELSGSTIDQEDSNNSYRRKGVTSSGGDSRSSTSTMDRPPASPSGLSRRFSRRGNEDFADYNVHPISGEGRPTSMIGSTRNDHLNQLVNNNIGGDDDIIQIKRGGIGALQSIPYTPQTLEGQQQQQQQQQQAGQLIASRSSLDNGIGIVVSSSRDQQPLLLHSQPQGNQSYQQQLQVQQQQQQQQHQQQQSTPQQPPGTPLPPLTPQQPNYSSPPPYDPSKFEGSIMGRMTPPGGPLPNTPLIPGANTITMPHPQQTQGGQQQQQQPQGGQQVQQQQQQGNNQQTQQQQAQQAQQNQSSQLSLQPPQGGQQQQQSGQSSSSQTIQNPPPTPALNPNLQQDHEVLRKDSSPLHPIHQHKHKYSSAPIGTGSIDPLILEAKYRKVKALYFEGVSEIEKLQNALAQHRLNVYRSSLDDNEYQQRFDRLNGAIKNVSYEIRQSWATLPPWIATLVSSTPGGREMTAIGRAAISRWVVDEIFERFFHPALEPTISYWLKSIEYSIRKFSPQPQTPAEDDELNMKVATWRLTTLDALQDHLNSPRAQELKKQLTDHLVEKLDGQLRSYLKDPPPPGLTAGVAMLVDIAVGLACHLPMESRAVNVWYPLPGQRYDSKYMKNEGTLQGPPVQEPGAAAAAAEGAAGEDEQQAEGSAASGGDRKKRKDAKKQAAAAQAQAQQQQQAAAAAAAAAAANADGDSKQEVSGLIRIAGFMAVEVRGRSILYKAHVWL